MSEKYAFTLGHHHIPWHPLGTMWSISKFMELKILLILDLWNDSPIKNPLTIGSTYCVFSKKLLVKIPVQPVLATVVPYEVNLSYALRYAKARIHQMTQNTSHSMLKPSREYLITYQASVLRRV